MGGFLKAAVGSTLGSILPGVLSFVLLSFYSTDLWIVVVAAVQVVSIIPGVPVGGTLKAIVSSSHGFMAWGGSTPGRDRSIVDEGALVRGEFFVGTLMFFRSHKIVLFLF